MRHKRHAVGTVAAALVVAMLSAQLWAPAALAVTVWDGGGTDDNWTTGANWVGDIAPGTGNTVEIQFAGPTRLTPNVDTNDPWVVRSIVFNSGAGAFDIGGFEISLQGSGTVLQNSSSATQTFTSNLQVTGGGKTFTASSGDIVIDGSLDLQTSVTARGGRNLTVNGLISGASGTSIGRTDGGILKLTNAGNTFSGNPGISHGVLETASIADSGVVCAIGTGTAVRLGQGTWGPSDTGTLRYTGPTASTNRAIQMTSNGTTQASHTLPFSGRPTIEVTDPNTTLTFNGDFAYSGSSTLGQWRLRGAGNGVINGNITTAGARLEKSGTGMWTINGSSNHSDITEVLGGVLTISNPSALGTTAAGTTVASSAAQLRLIGGITVDEPLTISGNGTGSATGNRGALRSYSGNNVWNGPITVVGTGETWINSAGGALTLSGGITGTNVMLRLDQGSPVVTGNPIDLGAGGTLLANSSGFLSVAGNTFGTLVVDWGGNFHMGVANALPANVTVKMGSGSSGGGINGKLDLYGYDQTIGMLMDGAAVHTGEVVTNSNTTTPATLTIDQSAASTYLGTITGNLALTKSGVGTLTLGGTNSYQGATTVSEGTLLVTGSIASSPMTTVAAGATLGGTGTIGPLTLNGILSPGLSPGTLHAGDTAWNGGGEYLWEISDYDGTAGVDWDLLDITGSLTIGATEADPFTIIVSALPAGDAAGALELFDSFEIARTTEGIIGFDSRSFVLDTSGISYDPSNYWAVTQEGNSLYLNHVPEPATLSLLGLGALGLLARRRRK